MLVPGIYLINISNTNCYLSLLTWRENSQGPIFWQSSVPVWHTSAGTAEHPAEKNGKFLGMEAGVLWRLYQPMQGVEMMNL